MRDLPELGRVWRVGLASGPLSFVPAERRSYNNRFDDLRQRFGTLYCALVPETALREVLADLRPDAAAIARYVKIHGPEAARDIPSASVTAVWRQHHVLAPARLQLEGPVLDLTDVEQRRTIELYHAALLAEHGLAHLDMHEITTPRRVVTKTIAADAFERLEIAAIRFASRLDGLPCYALFEGRGRLASAGEVLALTDPAPEALQNVAAGWQLKLETSRVAAIPQRGQQM